MGENATKPETVTLPLMWTQYDDDHYRLFLGPIYVGAVYCMGYGYKPKWKADAHTPWIVHHKTYPDQKSAIEGLVAAVRAMEAQGR